MWWFWSTVVTVCTICIAHRPHCGYYLYHLHCPQTALWLPCVPSALPTDRTVVTICTICIAHRPHCGYRVYHLHCPQTDTVVTVCTICIAHRPHCGYRVYHLHCPQTDTVVTVCTICIAQRLYLQFSESEINRFLFALDMPLDSTHCEKLIIDRTTLLCIVKHRASTWLWTFGCHTRLGIASPSYQLLSNVCPSDETDLTSFSPWTDRKIERLATATFRCCSSHSWLSA